MFLAHQVHLSRSNAQLIPSPHNHILIQEYLILPIFVQENNIQARQIVFSLSYDSKKTNEKELL